MTRPGALTALASAAAAVLALAGCASSDDQAEDPGTSASPTSAAPTPAPSESTPTSESATSTPSTGVSVDVTFDGDNVTPNGERVKVPVGEDVTLDVTADEAGEIHVHSTPEQELEYAAGTSTVVIKNLDQPGVVEVESHDLDKVILQLQVQ